MFSLKHLFTSPKADGTDPTLVKPSNWNDEHNFQASTDGVVVGRAIGAGAGSMQELPLSTLFPPGIILEYGGTTAPAGWYTCDGQVINRADAPNLFAVIGTTYNLGGESSSQFRLPDLRGRTAVHPDNGTGRISAQIPNASTVGSSGGVQQEQARVYGNVSVSGWSDPNNAYYTSPPGYASAGAGSGAGSDFVKIGNLPNVYINGITGNIIDNGGNLTQVQTNMQPCLILLYIIKA